MNEKPLLEALARTQPGHRPRTHHREPDGRPTYTNRLILESSPYLLQHAHNPVDWWPWGPEAFAEAERRNVPVFLSVGYSTCHWCHVMEAESFEDLEIAAVLNERFVPVKVDREERPDVDAVFMEVVQVMTGHGGWPMSVFLTPKRRPLFAGTYFPPRDGDRAGTRGFLSLLRILDANWQDPRFAGHGEAVMEALEKHAAPPPGHTLPEPEALDAAARAFARTFDPEWGGFGPAPKFPRPAVLDLLLRQWHRTRDSGLLECVDTTLTRMACGGLYDHVGGGFARYSVDRYWRIPHFEKMLYDNAQLVVSYVEAWQATGRPFFADVARDVLAWLERDMSDPAGGFYSATDADSEGEEGRFFVWTPAELEAALGPDDARWVAQTFDVTPEGNFEGRNVLYLREPLSPQGASRWARIRPLLHAAREQREHPGLDDKVVCAWNGLAISAFARAGFALDEPRWVDRAARAADFVLRDMRSGGRLLRSWRGGRAAPHPAVLEDYAAMVGALLDLLEATGAPRWLDAALELQAVQDARFGDPDRGGYFRTADDAERLPIREKPEQDGAEPSGNALAALALLRLSEITGEARHRKAAEATVRALDRYVRQMPAAVPKLLCALTWIHGEPRQVVLVGRAEETEALLAPVRRRFVPEKVVLTDEPGGALAGRLPLFADRGPVGGRAAAYVCVGTTCELPVTEPSALARQLETV